MHQGAQVNLYKRDLLLREIYADIRFAVNTTSYAITESNRRWRQMCYDNKNNTKYNWRIVQVKSIKLLQHV